MAAEFIGSTVLVTLHSPPQAQVFGVVENIFEHQLILRDVLWLASGRRTPHFQVPSSNLIDLEIKPDEPPQHPQDAPLTTQQKPYHESTVSAVSNGSYYTSPDPSYLHASLDPAILSVGRPIPNLNIDSKDDSPKSSHPPIPQHMLVEAALNSPTRATPSIPLHFPKPSMPSSPQTLARTDSMATATLTAPFDDLSLGSNCDDGSNTGTAELGVQEAKEGQTYLPDPFAALGVPGGRRGKRGSKKSAKSSTTAHMSESSLQPLVEQEPSSPFARKGKPKGRRQQTPIVEADSLGVDMGPPGRRAKQSKQTVRKQRKRIIETQNGWATEDATDIQELGDFDFEANLSKFNKHEIFKKLKEDDTTAEESRLVSHNRLPKPGTAGGRNLHWTENVLDSPHVGPNGYRWTSEADGSLDEISENRISSERSSRRNQSKSSVRRAPLRKNSGKTADVSGSKMLSASISSMRQSSFDASGSPKPKRNLSTSPYLGSVATTRPSLRIIGTNRICPCLSPLQMLEYEQFAITELNLSEDILTENAARGIAEGTFKAVTKEENMNPSNPHIIVLAGNHRSGARALAASRHLRNHGFKVTATIMGIEREEDLLDIVKQQITAYRKAGGQMMKPSDLLSGLKNSTLAPTLVIDSLLGIHMHFDDLRTDDQAWYFELVLLMNKTEAAVLSIDVPSGLDPSTGEVTTAESNPLAFYPRYILSLGAPKPWLLITLNQLKDEPQLFVADIGISNAVWKRLGGSRRNKVQGVEFGREWVVGLRYHAGSDG